VIGVLVLPLGWRDHGFKDPLLELQQSIHKKKACSTPKNNKQAYKPGSVCQRKASMLTIYLGL
jgi:hypothetical protein